MSKKHYQTPAVLRSPFRHLPQSLGMYRYGWRAIQLVWQTNWRLTVVYGLLTVVAGLLPAAIAYVGKLIVDAVIVAAQSGLVADRNTALLYLAIEAVLVAVLAGARQGISLCQSLLRVLLGQRVNLMI